MLKEDTTTWQHYGITIGVEPNRSNLPTPQVGQNCYAAIDTITINSKKYKKFYYLGWGSSINYSFKTLAGYLREDTVTRKVYYRLNTTSSDELLYDFSLNVNDSVYLSFTNSPSNSGYYRIDSIVTKNVNVGPRKHFYYRKHVGNFNPTNNYYEHIESVGSSHHIAYIFGGTPSPWNFPLAATCKPRWEIGLTCKHDDNKKIFQNCIMTNTSSAFYLIGQDSCDFGYFVAGGLKSNDLDRLVKIGPNPANDKVEVSIEQNFENINCSVTDMTGKIIFTLPKASMSADKKSFSFSTKDLAPGIYILQVKLNESLVKRPIVVQH
jgi:hypothetical protein